MHSLQKFTAIISFLLWASAQPTIAQKIKFEDQSEQAGVRMTEGSYGVAVGDFDNDGWDDIYFAGNRGSSTLLRNKRDGTFEDVTELLGVHVNGDAVNPLWGDINNDGFLDLYVGTRSEGSTGSFFLGTSTGRFVNISGEVGIELNAQVGSATFGDFDNDGWLDLFIATRGSADLLYKNVYDGLSYFEDVSQQAGMSGLAHSIAMQATWIDFNKDFNIDLFAVHDGNLRSRVYRNYSFLPFVDITNSANLEVARSAMGVSWGDYDNDGWPDVYVTNIGRGNLFRNMGDGTFEDVTNRTGVGRNGMSWGVVFSDFDNDGDEDLFIGNTFDFDQRRSILYENRDGFFVDVASQAGAALGTNTFGVATGDFNRDGLSDLIITDDGGDNRLLINMSEHPGNWIKFSLKGVTKNNAAIGVQLKAVAGEKTYYRTVSGGASFCSQISSEIHIGIGQARVVDSLFIYWGPQLSELVTEIPINQSHRIVQDEASSVSLENPGNSPVIRSASTVFPNPASNTATIEYSLVETEFVSVEVYDNIGRKIEERAGWTQPAGTFRLHIELSDYGSGLYHYRLRVGRTVQTGKLVVSK